MYILLLVLVHHTSWRLPLLESVWGAPSSARIQPATFIEEGAALVRVGNVYRYKLAEFSGKLDIGVREDAPIQQYR